MDLCLLIARLVVTDFAVILLECLPNPCYVPMTEDAPYPRKERVLVAITGDILL